MNIKIYSVNTHKKAKNSIITTFPVQATAYNIWFFMSHTARHKVTPKTKLAVPLNRKVPLTLSTWIQHIDPQSIVPPVEVDGLNLHHRWLNFFDSVLPGTHLPTSERWKAELALQDEEIWRSDSICSKLQDIF